MCAGATIDRGGGSDTHRGRRDRVIHSKSCKQIKRTREKKREKEREGEGERGRRRERERERGR